MIGRVAEAVPPPSSATVSLAVNVNEAAGDGATDVSRAVRCLHRPDGRVVSYDWQFGDGKRGTGPTVAGVGRSPGSLAVRFDLPAVA